MSRRETDRLSDPRYREAVIGKVEDYTNAFLVSAFFLVFIVLFAIWAVWGLLMAGLVSWVADRLITVDFRRS